MKPETPKRNQLGRPNVKAAAILQYLRTRADKTGYTGLVSREEIEAATGAERAWISTTIQKARAAGELESVVARGGSGNCRAYRFLDAKKAVA